MTAKILTAADFVALAAINSSPILADCLARSPDIASGRLPLIEIRDAPSMAKAYNQGLARTSAKICLLVHQDVYLPSGWLDRAVDMLNALAHIDPGWRVAGPYGIAADGTPVGRVWDVALGRELGQGGFSPAAVRSFDELLLVLNRSTPYSFDEQLPHFHLYGTDLAQAALAEGRGAWAVDLPVVHNNRAVESLRGGYALAYHYARRKWRKCLPIHTSVCTLTNNPLVLLRAQWRRRWVKKRPDGVSADSVKVAQRAGYE